MKGLRDILHAVGLIYDTDMDTLPAPDVTPTVTRTRTTTRQDMPDDMTWTPVRNVPYVHDTERDTDSDTVTHDWTRWTPGHGQRHGHVTDMDMDTMTRAGLQEDKYRTLKAIWATGASAADAARQLRGRRGYGRRTIEKYWAAFNSTTQGEGAPAN